MWENTSARLEIQRVFIPQMGGKYVLIYAVCMSYRLAWRKKKSDGRKPGRMLMHQRSFVKTESERVLFQLSFCYTAVFHVYYQKLH